MRKRVLRRHRIDTEPAVPEQPIDSSSFDTLEPDVLMRTFEARYAAALPRLIEVAMGQLAMDKALKNIEAGLAEINEDIRPATPENHATIEAAHMQAYRYVVISEALRGTVPDEHLHDTTLRFMEAHTRPVGTDTSLRKVLQRAIRDAGVAGAEPNPAGTAPNGDGAANPFGVAVTRPARTQPIIARGGRVKT